MDVVKEDVELVGVREEDAVEMEKDDWSFWPLKEPAKF